MGLKDKRTKWTRQSLIQVNEEMVLGFQEIELGQVWSSLMSTRRTVSPRTKWRKYTDIRWKNTISSPGGMLNPCRTWPSTPK